MWTDLVFATESDLIGGGVVATEKFSILNEAEQQALYYENNIFSSTILQKLGINGSIP